MANLNDIAGFRLPGWLAWYLNYRLTGLSVRDRRRQRLVNTLVLSFAALSLAHSVGFALFDPALWPATVVSLLFAFHWLLVPFVYRWGLDSTAIGTTIVACIGLLGLTYLLGSGAGLHLYLFVAPPVWIAALGASALRPMVLTTALAIAGLLICILLLQEPALVAASNLVFQTATLIVSVSATTCMILIAGIITVHRAESAEDALEVAHARSEALLYNLLPEDIAARLKDNPGRTIADNLPRIAVLFADIVDFTPRAARMTPVEVVDFLNRIFSTFDELAERHGLEKIKTIGDAYMVAAGMPNPIDNPVHRVAAMALDMLDALRAISDDLGENIEIRIGLHTGPAVAGVIGNQKLFYDVWGETVNTASRMESHGAAGHIQVTDTAKAELDETYMFEPRGVVEVKGMGPVETWWLTAPIAPKIPV